MDEYKLDETLEKVEVVDLALKLSDDVTVTKELDSIDKISFENSNFIGMREWERDKVILDKVNELIAQVNILIRYLKKNAKS